MTEPLNPEALAVEAIQNCVEQRRMDNPEYPSAHYVDGKGACAVCIKDAIEKALKHERSGHQWGEAAFGVADTGRTYRGCCVCGYFEDITGKYDVAKEGGA